MHSPFIEKSMAGRINKPIVLKCKLNALGYRITPCGNKMFHNPFSLGYVLERH